MNEVRCAYCHANDGALGICTHCGATHHPECYLEHRKCAACHRDDSVVNGEELLVEMFRDFDAGWAESGHSEFSPAERVCLKLMAKWILINYRVEKR